MFEPRPALAAIIGLGFISLLVVILLVIRTQAGDLNF